MIDDLEGTGSAAIAEELREQTILGVGNLADRERARLSKVLFPDTHTTDVELLGVTRKVRPLPVKWARQLHAIVHPFQDAVGAEVQAQVAGAEPSKTVTEVEILKTLFDSAEVLASYYKWEDVAAALREEEITLAEVQALVVRQMQVQADNDFLLTGLRMLIVIMQQAEMRSVRYQSLLGGPV